MSTVCPNCGNNVELSAGGYCPHCDVNLRPIDKQDLDGGLRARDLSAETLPHPSSLPIEDVQLLHDPNVRPPSRLGSIGRIGKFEIVKALGQGAVARVYLATEPVTGASVALKMLRPELADDPRIVKAFLREARHMYELAHPNILKVLEISGPDEGAFFVMPLARGDSLDERIGPGGMPGDDVLDICVQVAEGLGYAHGKGLLHRDLKPANILLDEDGRALVADFGMVRPFFNDTMIDVKKVRPEGTPAYMSPRVAAGLAEDTRGDIYAFGATMYEMLAGNAPYTGRDPMAVIQAVVDGPPESLSNVNPNVPKELVYVVETCMARELRDRYASMSDVLEDLRLIRCDEAPRGIHGTNIVQEETVPHSSTKIIPVALAVLAGVVVCSAATYGLIHLLAHAEKAEVANVVPADTDQLDEEPREETKGSPAFSEEEYRAILKDDPDNLEALRAIGLLEFERERFRVGTEHLRKAHQLKPDDAELGAILVQHFISIGHFEPARKTLERLLESDPDSEAAMKLLKELDAAEKNDDRLDSRRPPMGPDSRGGRPRPRDEARMRPGPPGDRHPPEGPDSSWDEPPMGPPPQQNDPE